MTGTRQLGGVDGVDLTDEVVPPYSHDFRFIPAETGLGEDLRSSTPNLERYVHTPTYVGSYYTCTRRHFREYTTDDFITATDINRYDFYPDWDKRALGDGHVLASFQLEPEKDDLYITRGCYKFHVKGPRPLTLSWLEIFQPDETTLAPQLTLRTWAVPQTGDDFDSPVWEINPAVRRVNGRYSLTRVELMVDANRDGAMSFISAGVHDQDATSPEKPFRFWLNNDRDAESKDLRVDGSPDSGSAFIYYERQLEDFTRLWVSFRGITQLLKTGGVTAELQLQPTKDTPSLKLFRHVDQAHDFGTGYVSDHAIAGAQLANLQNQAQIGPTLTPSAPLDLVSNCPDLIAGISENHPDLHFLFEGVTAGKGNLRLVLKKNGVVIGIYPSLFLDLRDIKTMYQHKLLGGDEDPWSGYSFEQDPTETGDAIVFVHGWRWSPADTATYAETVFKRLWWRGFKGRFAAVRWNTYFNATEHEWLPFAGQAIDVYLAKYNDSEHNAWEVGSGLSEFVRSELPTGYTKNVVAHSLGNVVVGAALESGMTINNYALLNAAISAACYDEDPILAQPAKPVVIAGVTFNLWDQNSPDDDPDPATRGLAYRSRLKNVQGNLISFCLPGDHATVFAWEVNNSFTKPPAQIVSSLFRYDRTAAGGQKLKKLGLDEQGGLTLDYYLTDRNEAEPFACRTWSKSVGAEKRTHGPIATTVDMSEDRFSPGSTGGFADEHNAEFNRSIQQTAPFFNELLNQLNIAPNP